MDDIFANSCSRCCSRLWRRSASSEEGKQFHFEHGRLCLNRRGAFLADVFLGPYVEETELGIDLGDAGKSRTTAKAAGLAFPLTPVALRTKEEVRFPNVGL